MKKFNVSIDYDCGDNFSYSCRLKEKNTLHTYILKTSKNDDNLSIGYRNTEVGRLVDTENGVIIKVDGESHMFDYGQMEYLEALLAVYNKNATENNTKQIIVRRK